MLQQLYEDMHLKKMLPTPYSTKMVSDLSRKYPIQAVYGVATKASTVDVLKRINKDCRDLEKIGHKTEGAFRDLEQLETEQCAALPSSKETCGYLWLVVRCPFQFAIWCKEQCRMLINIILECNLDLGSHGLSVVYFDSTGGFLSRATTDLKQSPRIFLYSAVVQNHYDASSSAQLPVSFMDFATAYQSVPTILQFLML